MLSRVADSIYWMARYMERAENISRLLLSTQDLLLDAGADVNAISGGGSWILDDIAAQGGEVEVLGTSRRMPRAQQPRLITTLESVEARPHEFFCRPWLWLRHGSIFTCRVERTMPPCSDRSLDFPP